MSHTKEPWKVDGLNYPTDIYGSPDEKHIGPTLIATTKVEDFGYAMAKQNATRIVAAVNGCAGLNPVAYRECVEALKLSLHCWTHPEAETRAYEAMRQALLHAEVPHA